MTAVLAVAPVLVAAWALRALRRWLPPHGLGARDRRRPATLSGDLERLQRMVAAACHAGEVHWRLRPVVREVAAAGLRRRRVDLDADPIAARALLSPRTWELVRPDRPRPHDSFAPGLGRDELRAVLDDLEALMR